MEGYAPFPMPNDKILGGTVIASTWFNEEDYDFPLVLVMLLMPEAPYYRVGTVELHPFGYEWEAPPEQHDNIVPAVNGDDFPNPDPNNVHLMVGPRANGYTDMGGDY